MDMAAKGAHQLHQHYVCRDYKTFQRGNGMGRVHHRHNAHRLYLMDEIEHVKKPPDDEHVKKLKLNPDKTEFLLVGSPHNISRISAPKQSLFSPMAPFTVQHQSTSVS